MPTATEWTPDIGDPRWERVRIGDLEVAWVFRGLGGAAYWVRGKSPARGPQKFSHRTGSANDTGLAKAAVTRMLARWWP